MIPSIIRLGRPTRGREIFTFLFSDHFILKTVIQHQYHVEGYQNPHLTFQRLARTLQIVPRTILRCTQPSSPDGKNAYGKSNGPAASANLITLPPLPADPTDSFVFTCLNEADDGILPVLADPVPLEPSLGLALCRDGAVRTVPSLPANEPSEALCRGAVRSNPSEKGIGVWKGVCSTVFVEWTLLASEEEEV